MEEIKIGGEIKEGYMGGIAWTGCNYKGYMRYSEINKIVKKAFLEKYKGTKVSCSGSSFSGGQECVGKIIVKLNDAIYSFEEFRKNIDNYYNEHKYCFQIASYLNEWHIKEYFKDSERDFYNTSYEEMLKIAYEKNIKVYKAGCNMDRPSELDKMILKEDVCKKVFYLSALYDSFNDNDNNEMVDYFSNMFYKDIILKCEE